MSNAVISIKVDPQLKQQASDIAKHLGIPLATYLKMALHTLVREKTVHASLSEIPLPKVSKRWKKQQKDVQQGKNISPPFKTVKSLRASLES